MIRVGDRLDGFCDGYFGRDSYEVKQVEAVGRDWVVARDDAGEIHFACAKHIHQALAEHVVDPSSREEKP